MFYRWPLFLLCAVALAGPVAADPSFKPYELECLGNQTQQPWSVAYAEDGTFYVADMRGSAVEHFDACGQLLARWGTAGTGESQLLWPTGIALDRDTVYVTDIGTRRVRKFLTDGTFLAAFGGYASLDVPYGVAIDRCGNVCVADLGRQSIVVFDRAGRVVREFRTKAGIDLAIDRNGDIYVAGFSGWLQKFTADGTLLREVLVPDPAIVTQFRAVALDRQGRVHYVHTAGRRILVFDTRLRLLGQWQLPPELGPRPFLFDLAFDDRGRAVMTNEFEPKITVYRARPSPWRDDLTEVRTTTWGRVKAAYRK